MASFFTPLSGLDANSKALNTIANNLSNMNTTGFKSQSVNFSDLFYQQVGTAGSGDPIQRGSGTKSRPSRPTSPMAHPTLPMSIPTLPCRATDSSWSMTAAQVCSPVPETSRQI